MNRSENTKKFLRRLIPWLEKYAESFITVKFKPTFSDNYKPAVEYQDQKRRNTTAIVIQGPLISDKSFTLETLKLYRKNYPNAYIIFSTWVGLPDEFKEAAAQLKVIIVESEIPSQKGIQNINFQLVSTAAGLAKAADVGVRYCLKTRSDQRLYQRNFLATLHSALEGFPIEKKTSQKERLVTVSANFKKFRPYGITDFLTYGGLEDMQRYWGAPLDLRQSIAEQPKTMRQFAENSICEVYLAKVFFESLGYSLDGSIGQSWELIKNHFCILDKESVGFYWPKYDSVFENNTNPYELNKNNEDFSFSEWFCLYTNNLACKKETEGFLDISPNGEIASRC